MSDFWEGIGLDGEETRRRLEFIEDYAKKGVLWLVSHEPWLDPDFKGEDLMDTFEMGGGFTNIFDSLDKAMEFKKFVVSRGYEACQINIGPMELNNTDLPSY
jgi:hypothetical protein